MPRYTIIAQLGNLHATAADVVFRDFALRSSGTAGGALKGKRGYTRRYTVVVKGTAAEQR